MTCSNTVTKGWLMSCKTRQQVCHTAPAISVRKAGVVLPPPVEGSEQREMIFEKLI